MIARAFDHLLGRVRAIASGLPDRPKLPTVLTKEEVRRVLALVSPDYQLACRLLYGTGLRLLECLRLRAKMRRASLATICFVAVQPQEAR